MSGGILRESVAFDDYTETPDDYGGFTQDWSEHHACRAEFIYNKGGEDTQAARFQGSKVYKIKIRSCVAARAITTEMRMRDVRRDVTYNVREVDQISDPAWVYIVAESGVAA